MLKWTAAMTAALGLSACSSGGLDPVHQGPKLPIGTQKIKDTDDGLIVGHRLMSAGEYELALRAYLRAGGEQGLTPDVLSALGSANLRLGRLGQAEDLLRQAVKEDQTFVPAWNNLGVVLMETGRSGEARQVFKTAFALDSGESAEIRENLRLAIAKSDVPGYSTENNHKFDLVRRGGGKYLLLRTPRGS